MSDIFISYSKEFRGLTQELAQELQDRGFSVWWDSDLLSGDRFREVILAELAQARAAIVIWTPASIKSDWVYSEASRARARGILIPVRHADIAVQDIPPPFDALHTELVSNRLVLYAALAKFGVSASATAQPKPVVSPSALSEAAVSEAVALAHWETVKATSDPDRLREFLREFAARRIAKLAQNRLAQLEAATWARLPKRRTIEALTGFLADVPDGANAKSAKSELTALRRSQQEQVTKISAGPAGTKASGSSRLLLGGAGVLALVLLIGLWGLLSIAGWALEPKDAFKECENCPEMMVVPAGSFTMGSPTSEEGRSNSEGPQHRVTFAKAFAVGRFAVTFDEWDACVAGGGCNGYRPSDEGWGRGRQPVINVSWSDAKAYMAWLSRKTGKTYRLLSEAEREYATRAGTTTPFWFGASISTAQANYDGDYFYGSGKKGESRQKTLPVDSFEPNPWGLYQVHGNIWEWVEDCAHDNYTGAPADGSAWITGDCSSRVFRGGSWSYAPRYARAAQRNGIEPDYRSGDIGFRLARTLTP